MFFLCLNACILNEKIQTGIKIKITANYTCTCRSFFSWYSPCKLCCCCYCWSKMHMHENFLLYHLIIQIYIYYIGTRLHDYLKKKKEKLDIWPRSGNQFRQFGSCLWSKLWKWLIMKFHSVFFAILFLSIMLFWYYHL